MIDYTIQLLGESTRMIGIYINSWEKVLPMIEYLLSNCWDKVSMIGSIYKHRLGESIDDWDYILPIIDSKSSMIVYIYKPSSRKYPMIVYINSWEKVSMIGSIYKHWEKVSPNWEYI